MFEFIAAAFLGGLALGGLTGWWVDHNAWKADQTAAYEVSVAQYTTEVNLQNLQAATLQTQLVEDHHATAVLSQRANDLAKSDPDPTVCLDPNRVQLINTALSGAAPASGGANGPLPVYPPPDW
jgi:hypothetical protein